MFVLPIIGYVLWVIYELIPLYKQKRLKDLWLNVALGIFSFSTAVLLSLNIEIPSPERPIRELIISIFGK